MRNYLKLMKHKYVYKVQRIFQLVSLLEIVNVVNSFSHNVRAMASATVYHQKMYTSQFISMSSTTRQKSFTKIPHTKIHKSWSTTIDVCSKNGNFGLMKIRSKISICIKCMHVKKTCIQKNEVSDFFLRYLIRVLLWKEVGTNGDSGPDKSRTNIYSGKHIGQCYKTSDFSVVLLSMGP